MTSELLAAVERIRPVIQAHADTAEAERRLTGAAYDAMYEAGLFGMLAPGPMEAWRFIRSRRCGSGRPWRASIRPRPGTWS